MTDDTDAPAQGAEGAVRETATVATPHAARYLGQLCKHFAHKLPGVEFTPSEGVVPFSIGTARLRADEGALTLDLEASPAEMDDLKDVVVRHLVRFAFREELTFDWRVA
ncbi:DUF2218 domain-containing protein [Amaricoccus sp. W119]|uniref:DUF2218 domain-containing protein n=1 Tax=Amaricoccus sp. W119 TaxID=3391833 RepID=UPI0039A55554